MHKPSYRALRIKARALLATALLLALTRPAPADDVADFYRGRTLTILISYSVGGGYDLYARLLVDYLDRHIPGNPTVVPENMPGAGGLRASNYLYSAAS